ncbi:MAG: phosphoglycolate phosphatase [marine bacterium B5-7]|nr:MAG: phosphoglycolate phosphatase [marine bacterium B5-7]
MKFSAVLFDLDGTLLDTSQDLANALNDLLQDHGQPALPYRMIREKLSLGGKGLIELGFKPLPDKESLLALREQFFQYYTERMHENTALFPGMQSVLDYLAEKSLPWGIVTNKHVRFSEPVVEKLGLSHGSLICGDTLPVCKPHPDPLFKACEELGVDPTHCVYIGDAERDIEAGRRAGMKTIAAKYGYLTEDEDIDAWQADVVIESPEMLLQLL